MFELSKYNTNAREILQDFNAYTTMEAQTFKETIIQNMDSIEQCIIERASHEQELKMTLKKLSERQLQIQQCKVQEVQSSVTSSGDETSSRIVSDEEIEKKKLEAHYGFMAKIQEVLPAESIVNQKHDELAKKSLLTRSQFEGQLKEKSKVISDLKVKEGKDIDTMIEMDKQIKFLNEILYKRNQSIQTIHMLAPKCATYKGRSTFANPKYLKIAQSEKPRLYEIPYDTSDPANRFCPNGEETVTLEKESRSKLDKDKGQMVTFDSKFVSVSGIVIAESKVRATTRSAVHMGSSSIRKSTTKRLSNFLAKGLISWQCKKQTIVANSTTLKQETSSGSGPVPRYHIWEVQKLNYFEVASKNESNDPPLLRVNTLGMWGGQHETNELMEY
ncbi:hypothetical protein Tco_1420914 [Tanacetum coccineum]